MNAPTIAAMKPAPSLVSYQPIVMAEPSGNQRAGDPEQDRDDATAWVLAGHEELGDRAGKAADDDPTDNAVTVPSTRFPSSIVVQATLGLRAATRTRGTSATVSRKAVAIVNPAALLLHGVTYSGNTVPTILKNLASWQGMMNRETSIRSSDTLVVTDRASRRRWVIIAAAALVVLVVIAAAMLMSRGADEKANTAAAAKGAGQVPTVTVIVPGQSQVARTIVASGPLAAKRDQPIGIAGQGGRVVRVLVDAGSWVRGGPGARSRRPLRAGPAGGAARRPGRSGARQCGARPGQL